MEILKNIKLQINNVSFSYGKICVLKDISLCIETGSFVSILGPSGCGKTTLIRLICGLLSVNSGSILLDNSDITNLLPGKRNIGVVFQESVLFANMTAIRNIEYVLKCHQKFKYDYKDLAKIALNDVGMLEHKDKYPNQLSLGQQQKVAIARSMALKPKILLLDEPLSSLDANVRFALRNELKRIQTQTNVSMVYVTHDQEEALSLSDKVVILNNGIVQQIDTPLNIIRNPANEFVNEFVIKNIKIKLEAFKWLAKEGFE